MLHVLDTNVQFRSCQVPQTAAAATGIQRSQVAKLKTETRCACYRTGLTSAWVGVCTARYRGNRHGWGSRETAQSQALSAHEQLARMSSPCGIASICSATLPRYQRRIVSRPRDGRWRARSPAGCRDAGLVHASPSRDDSLRHRHLHVSGRIADFSSMTRRYLRAASDHGDLNAAWS